MFAQQKNQSPPVDQDVRIGGVAIANAGADEDDGPADENLAIEGSRRVPGKSPLWEQPSKFDRQLSRLDQQPHGSAETAVTPQPRRRGAAAAGISDDRDCRSSGAN